MERGERNGAGHDSPSPSALDGEGARGWGAALPPNGGPQGVRGGGRAQGPSKPRDGPPPPPTRRPPAPSPPAPREATRRASGRAGAPRHGAPPPPGAGGVPHPAESPAAKGRAAR